MQQDRLDKVIAKLKQQGIAEGRKDAEAVVAQARQEADGVLARARQEADSIVSKAKQEADRTRTQLDSDLRQAAQVGLEAYKQAVQKALVVPALESSLSPQLSDPRFLEQIIVEMVKGFSASGMKSADIDVILPADQKQKLEGHLALRLKTMASGAPSIKFTDEISAGLRMGPSGKDFVIDLSDEGFREVFMRFVSPRFRKLFFKDNA